MGRVVSDNIGECGGDDFASGVGLRMDLNHRLEDIERFNLAIERLENLQGGPTSLLKIRSGKKHPTHGVYFFFEQGEFRSGTLRKNRVVRVGTHGLKINSQSTLGKRLGQHMGSKSSGNGNHRGSIFRLLIGDALQARQPELRLSTWGAPRSIKNDEAGLELLVSQVIREMSVVLLEIDDVAGPESKRGLIERNSIALLSNYVPHGIDPPSPNWLGRFSSREKVVRSGMWNNRHVDENYDPRFFDVLENLVKIQMKKI